MISSALNSNLSLILSGSFSSFILALITTPLFIKFITKVQFTQKIKEESMDGSKTPLFNSLHKSKGGTPTMGGVVIWFTTFIICILSLLSVKLGWTNYSLINRKETYIPLFTLLSFGVLGLVDDYMNVKNLGRFKGLSAKAKTVWMTILGLMGAFWFYNKLGYSSVYLLGNDIELGLWYIPLFLFVILGTSNSVNITDGLDGLASGLSITALLSLATISFTKGLFILTAFCAVLAGAIAAFLWNNIPPAKFYMGDTGSLAIGATIGVIAMLTDTILVLPFIGFIFVIETLSVIIQLTSKKFRGKKVFDIAPIHHHFEYNGWKEFTVTMRFWMIGNFVAMFGLVLHLAKII